MYLSMVAPTHVMLICKSCCRASRQWKALGCNVIQKAKYWTDMVHQSPILCKKLV